MNDANTFGIAIAAMIVGGILLSFVYLSAQVVSRGRAPTIDSAPAFTSSLGGINDAVLVAQSGGKITYANHRAKLMFSSGVEMPSLNRMARMAQPQDALYDLFAAEGQTTLTINNRPLEALSVRLPGDTPQFMVTLRENTQLEKLRDSDSSAQAIAAIGEVSKTLFTSLNLNTVATNTLQIIERIVQFDVAEINLWDAQAQVIRPIARSGDRAYTITLNQKATTYNLDEGYTGWIARNKSPLLVGNIEQRFDVQPKIEPSDFPVHSIVGVPLLYGVDREFVGTLEIASIELDRYQPQDVQLLETIASQAVIAIRNAQRFDQQQMRVAELSGLAQVAQTASALANSRELNANLTGRIASLMGVQSCGILLYSESERALISQAPFYGGIPDAFLELYRIPLTPHGRAEHFWNDEEFWYSNDVMNDPLVAEAGLTQLAETIGVKTTLIAPLAAGSTRLGIVQVSNKMGGVPFGDEDARLLQIYAGQAAILIDNARLVRESEERVKRAEAIRLISEISGSSRPLEEIYREVMKRVAELLAVDFCILLLLDEAKGELVPQRGSEVGADFSEAEVVHIRSDDPSFQLSVTYLRKPFYTWRASRDRRITKMYRRVVEHYRVESAIIVPLIAQDSSIGELWLGARRERAFARNDVNLVETVAAQLASAVERNRLASITDETLRRRVEQLTALTRLGRELNQTLELEHLLQSVYTEALRATHADCGRIVLLDTSTAVPTASKRLGCRTQEDDRQLDSLEMNVALSGMSHLLPDLKSAEAFAKLTAVNDRQPTVAHDGIRSLIVVPVLSQGVTVGVIEMHSQRPNSFDQVMLDFLQTLSAQAAVAVSNTQRYEEQLQRSDLLRRRADQLSQLLQISRTIRSDNPLEASLEAIAFGIQETIGYNKVLISVLDAETNLVHRLAAAGVPFSTFDSLKSDPQPWIIYASCFKPEFRISQSYYVPHDQTPAELKQSGVRTTTSSWEGVGYWHDEDYFFVPLIGSGGQFVGIMSLDDPQDRHAPDRSTVETIEIFANQAALAIENARLFATTQRYAADLEQRVAERTMDLEKERDQVETLLRITNELSASLDLDRVLARALSLVNDVIGGTQGGLFLLDPQSEKLIYRTALGANVQLPASGMPTPFRRGEGLVGWVIKNRQATVVHDLLQDERWVQRPLSEQHRSAICAPLLFNEDALGAMIFYSDVTHAFNDDQLRLVSAAATQVTSAINNTELYRLIRDQAERLGGMLRANQVEASKSQAILESVADGVLVTDPEGKVILFNATAERILQLSRDEVLGRPANDFLGFYGAGAKNLTAAIRRWSEDPTSYQAGDLLAERIELEDNRIISVLLTPVTSTDEFLGSVSIFRDITREVEVDRIKTEFVTTASHELLTPITPIKGYADLLLMGAAGALTAGQQQAVELIKSNADRLQSLVDDLLDISRIESGKIELHLAPMPIQEVIDEVVTHLQERVNTQKPMHIVNNAPDDLPLVSADRERVIQIITNLADNAFSYTEAGGTITFEAHLEDGGLVVSVGDTGIGLSPEDRARMFERFYRAENPLVMASAGTGLGLSIVQRLVDMHEGKLWAESDGIGCGSTFYVRLKLVAETSEVLETSEV